MGDKPSWKLLLNRGTGNRTQYSIPGRTLALALLSLPVILRGQVLPPTAPTTPVAVNASRLPYTQTGSGQASRQALVAYTAGKLQITADNSSLNQILIEISRITGMKITGGVAEERVFGSYGPADPSVVLSTLLDGTGSNVMLRLNSAHKPAELVLTPRQGGATPPNPNSATYARRGDDLPPDRRFATPPQTTYPVVPPAPVQNPATSTPQPGPTAPANSAAGSDTTTQQSPNGVKTPQEIYEQLIKLQQQQPKPPQ